MFAWDLLSASRLRPRAGLSVSVADELTSPEFWRAYWRAKAPLTTRIGERWLFADLFDRILRRPIKSALEIGGFPGYFSIWLRKYRGLETDLLDFVVERELLSDLLAANDLPRDAVGAIEGDLFEVPARRQYDLVFSCGLIEHFGDTEAIVARHLPHLADHGTLFLEVPNFRGLNGWVQRRWDRDNYAKHNIDCMDPKKLAAICEKLGLTVERAGFHTGFGVWLETPASKPARARHTVAALSLAGRFLSPLLPPLKPFSPYIVVVARRP